MKKTLFLRHTLVRGKYFGNFSQIPWGKVYIFVLNFGIFVLNYGILVLDFRIFVLNPGAGGSFGIFSRIFTPDPSITSCGINNTLVQ